MSAPVETHRPAAIRYHASGLPERCRRAPNTIRDEEDDCNEGNVHLRHLKNTYEAAYGTPVPKSNNLQR